MKKVFGVIFALAVFFAVLPVQSFAKSDKVEIYGNRISSHAKQVCFVEGTADDSLSSIRAELSEPDFKTYYYVGDETVDFSEVAEKLPELQSLSVVHSKVKNTAALADLKDLVWLGLHYNDGAEDLSFLKNLTGLKKFKYTNIYSDNSCDNIKPVSYLKDLTELSIEVKWSAIEDITPLKGLTKLKKLELKHPGGDDLAVLKNMKNLRELTLDLSSETDMTFLSSLTRLEKLDISGDAQNLGAAAGLKKLKCLRIDANDGDLSCIGDITQLESLHISYSSKSFTKSLGRLKNLKELSLNTINNGNRYDTSFIPELTSLERLALSINYDYNLDISGISELKNFKHLELSECQFGNLSELKKCPALEEIIIDNCRSDFDIKWIEGADIKDLHISVGSGGSIKNISKVTALKDLEHLLLLFTGIPEQSVKKIKKSLPDCKIEVWEFDENYEIETKIY